MSYKITDTIIVDNNKNIASIGTALFAGPVIIGGGTSTGTVSQPLQVTGSNGAYIGGNLGIGSTNPSSKLWVSGDIYNAGIHTAQVLSASKDPGTGIATDFTNSLFGNGWRVTAPGSTTYYKLATLPPGDGGNTFDHLIINGVLGAWTNGNQTPFEITFSNRGTFNYKYASYGTVRSDVRIIGISTNSAVEIWAQHQASQFTKLVYTIANSIQAIVVSNPTSTTTAPTGTTVFDSSTVTPRFIINESDNVGVGTATPGSKLTVVGDGRFTGVVTATTFIGALTGTATSLSGGAAGNIVYQSGPNTTAFLTNGGSGTVLQSNGVGNAPTWVAAAPSGAVSGITVRDSNSNLVGTSGSITQLTFSSGLSVTGTTGAAGIATITLSSNIVGTSLSISGISTFNNTLNVVPTATSIAGLFSGTTSSDMVRITQLGTGNALVVEDSVNPDATPFVVKGDGSVGIGTNNPTVALQLSPNASISNLNASTNFGTTAGAAATVAQFYHLNGNASYLRIKATRNTAGADWTTASTKLLQVIDVTEMGYVEFNPNGSTQGMAFGSGATELVRLTSAGNFGIGTTNPQAQLHITGQFQSTQANSTTTGGGQIYLNGATGNRIDFNTNGGAAPSFTTRSVGTKIVLYPAVDASNVDIGFGIDAFTLWSSVPASTSQFKWYAGTTNIVTLFGTGELVLGTTSKTGTASQPLQVTGGAYVSGNLGVGNTNPSFKLDVSGLTAISNSQSQLLLHQASNTPTVIHRNDGSDYYILLSDNSTTPIGAWNALRPLSITLSTGRLNSNNGQYFTGNTLIGSASATGTASQPLQVTGGAYVSGSVGIGTTNPGATLNVVPTATSIAGLFSGTTSSDMVRITQLGTGNALVVEDSANPDSSPFVVTGIGSVGIGTASPAFTADIAGDARITSTNKMRFGGTAGTTNFYIQYNSTANSLDFVAG